MSRSSTHCRYAAGLILCLSAALFPRPLTAAETLAFDPRLFDELAARPIGPANMGGRIVDLAVVEGRPSIQYVASASGGLWKTVNNGITWQPIFEHESSVSLGAVALAPSNPDLVWVGTGEANARNSVSWGDGVYKSSDGGKTWKNMGLRDTRHIGRIVVHPRDPNVVYVAALGHVWGPNPERGLYKTVDGGRTWTAVKSLGANTGFIDLVVDSSDPETLFAAAYHVRRDGFAGGNPAEQYSVESGLYRSRDGGQTWIKLTGGLPDRPLGRCGLSICRKSPRVVYAVVQTDRTVLKRESELGQGAGISGDLNTGGVFRSLDGGDTWSKMNDLCPRPFYFAQVRVDPNDSQRVYVLGVNLHVSTDGGHSFRSDGAPSVHADHHALWIDPADSQHLLLGCDGGLNVSYDRGANWEHLQNLPLGQFYAIAVDMRRPYRVYGGLQDNGTWGGPSATRSREGITLAEWTRVLSADGFHCQVDPTDPDTVYAESQHGGLNRLNIRTGDAKGISPRSVEKGIVYRFNWSAPLLLSPHNPHVLWYGGNHLFRSLDRGDTWQTMSPDLTRGKPGPSPDYGHTITAIAESPRRAGLLYAGTDDGRVHVSRNGGAEWTDLSEHFPGVPPDRWISRIECSHFAEGTAYLAIDRHRQDDFTPYLFRTTDYGATWQAVTGSLPPEGPVLVVRADPRNRNLLFAGTEFGLFVSLDDGLSWQRLRGGLPTVAIHDLVIHARDRELVIATHGRSLYVLDISPLQELSRDVLRGEAHLCDVKPALLFQYRGAHGFGGKSYMVTNPPFGAEIWYYLKDKPARPPRLTVTDVLGTTVAVLPTSDQPGLHHVTWNLQATVGIGPVRYGPLVTPGEYAVRLEQGEKPQAKKLRVETEQ